MAVEVYSGRYLLGSRAGDAGAVRGRHNFCLGLQVLGGCGGDSNRSRGLSSAVLRADYLDRGNAGPGEADKD